jgi:hypothetical protein
MSLLAKLKEKQVRTETIEVDGDKFELRGLSKLERSKVFASARNSKSGKMDNDKLESLLLSACVFEPGGGAVTSDWKEWSGLPSHITGPLVAGVMRVCGLDQQDLGDPKDSDSTES